MAKILSIGSDETLLETRHRVLESAGAEVLSSNPEHALRLLTDQQCALLVICHTLSDGEIVDIFRVVDRQRFENRIIVLARRTNPSAGREIGCTFDSGRGPRALVQLAKDLLNRPLHTVQHCAPSPLAKVA